MVTKIVVEAYNIEWVPAYHEGVREAEACKECRKKPPKTVKVAVDLCELNWAIRREQDIEQTIRDDIRNTMENRYRHHGFESFQWRFV